MVTGFVPPRAYQPSISERLAEYCRLHTAEVQENEEGIEVLEAMQPTRDDSDYYEHEPERRVGMLREQLGQTDNGQAFYAAFEGALNRHYTGLR